MAVIEFKKESDRLAVYRMLNPKPLEAKIAYQKFREGKAVFTLITRD